MGSVVLAFRAWLRQRWQAGLGLALLLGLIGGVVLTAAAGARRTETAYPRLLRWSHAASVLVVPGCVGLGGFYTALGRLPQVASLWTGVIYELALPAGARVPEQLDAVASPDGALGLTTDRVRILAGHGSSAADPAAVMIDPELAAQQRLRPGSTLHLLGVPSTPKTCPAAAGPPGAQARPVPLAFQVAAVVAFDDQVVPAPGLSGAPRVLLSQGFWRAGTGRRFGPGDYAGVRLRPGMSQAAFRAAARRLASRYPAAGALSFVSLAGQVAATQRAIDPEAVSLAAFAALASLIGLAVLGQLLGRQLILDSADFGVLRALGMSRAALTILALARTGAATACGALIAAGFAVAASPLMPIGPARLAEPRPGVGVNLAILGAGLAAIAVVPVALLVPVAWRTAGRPPGPPGTVITPAAARRSRLAPALSLAGPVTGGIGVRMAFEPGRGRSAVPVRSALAVTAVALAAVLAAAVFGTSLIALIGTPHRYGQNWAQELDLQFAGVPGAKISKLMAAQPTAAGYAAGNYGQLSVDGKAVPAIGIDPVRGRAS